MNIKYIFLKIKILTFLKCINSEKSEAAVINPANVILLCTNKKLLQKRLWKCLLYNIIFLLSEWNSCWETLPVVMVRNYHAHYSYALLPGGSPSCKSLVQTGFNIQIRLDMFSCSFLTTPIHLMTNLLCRLHNKVRCSCLACGQTTHFCGFS